MPNGVTNRFAIAPRAPSLFQGYLQRARTRGALPRAARAPRVLAAPEAPAATAPTVGPPALPAGITPPRPAEVPERPFAPRTPETILGPFGDIIPDPENLRRREVPLLEVGLNLENIIKAEEDRARGIEELRAAFGNVGASPEAQLARELAVQRTQTARGPIRSQTALAAGDVGRRLAERFAAAGISGPSPQLKRAFAEQQIAVQGAALEEEALRQALEDLERLAAREEAERLALQQAIARAYLETERAPIDLSALIVPAPRGRIGV